jgi:streptogramin lyase
VAVGEGSVWVLDADGSVRRVDPVTSTVTTIEGVAEDPSAIAAGEEGVWVASGVNVLSRVDPASNQTGAPIHLVGYVDDVAVGDGAVWANADNRVLRIDPATGQMSELAGTVQLLAQQAREDGYRYVVAVGEGFVWETSVSDLMRHDAAGDRFELFTVGVAPRDMAVSEHDVWVVGCGTPGTVLRLDAQSGEVAATIAGGGAVCPSNTSLGDRMAIAAGDRAIWVTDAVNGTVNRIGETTNQVDVPIRVGDAPTALAVGLGSVWVTVDGADTGASPSESSP